MAEKNRVPDVRLELFSQPRLLAGARALISNIAQRIGFSEIICGQISLAIDEALCNITLTLSSGMVLAISRTV